MTEHDFRAGVLASMGAAPPEIEELLIYNKNLFDHSNLKLPVKFPLPDELFAGVWEDYISEAKGNGSFHCLRDKLVQLRFPVQEGISETEIYQSATRRGIPVDDTAGADGIILERPGEIEMVLYQSMAGRIPLLIIRNRKDFVSIVRALIMRNEPKPVPASMGACMAAGYNNWDRIRRYRRKWENENPSCRSEENWEKEFQKVIPKKELYHDRFIILSDGPYSGVSADKMGLSEEEWKLLSLAIRREHECTHYFTRRILSSMQNNLIDELIADCMGILSASGHFRADWFLHFMGLESFPDYRTGGRLQNYRGKPPLSDGAFKILQVLVKNAAENVESLSIQYSKMLSSLEGKGKFLIGMTYLTLEELASEEAGSLFQQALR